MSQTQRFNRPVSAPEYRVKRGAHDLEDGLTVKQVASATYDVSGGDDGSVGAHGLGVYIPDNAIITRVWYDVITTFTDGADDSATIALGLETQDVDAFTVAIAISAATNVWDAGIHHCLPGAPALGADAAHDTALEVAALIAGTFVKTTAERQILVTVADDGLTAGKMVIFVEYVISA